MPTNEPTTQPRQRVIPYLYYEDGLAAITFLCEVFGFDEQLAIRRDNGSLMHAELGCGEDRVMLATPVDGQGLPIRGTAGTTRHASVMCYVDDVDAHYAHAREAGAKVLAALEDKPYGDRMYTVEDPEGHHWHFAKRSGMPVQAEE